MWLLYSLVLSMFGLGKVMKCSNAFYNPITSSLLPLHWQKESSTNVEFSALLLGADRVNRTLDRCLGSTYFTTKLCLHLPPLWHYLFWTFFFCFFCFCSIESILFFFQAITPCNSCLIAKINNVFKFKV